MLNHEMSTIFRIVVAFSVFVLFLADPPPLLAAADPPTAYEIIESFNFPMGILPKGVTHYDLDKKTGKFNAYFNGSCSFSLEDSYQLNYKSKISGYIKNNKLTNLSGVSVKVLFLWLNIVEVSRQGENLDFSVGIAYAEFSIDNFFVCPQCGCGLNCKNMTENGERGNLGSNPLVSSI